MKVNWRRKVKSRMKLRVPPILKPNKTITPESIYNRDKEKEEVQREIKELIEEGVNDEAI